MTNRDNAVRELNLNELDAVSGAGALVDACNYARVVGALVALYNRPAVEVEADCGE